MEDFRFSVTLPTDDRGMLGRRCPACDQYFKIKPGTGLPVDDCRCPYCEHPDPASEFATREQIKYVESVGLNEYTRRVLDPMLRDWGRELERSTRNPLFQLHIRYDSHPIPLSYYLERQLETDVTCSHCRLEFAVYGVFATCPDCGKPNALDVFHGSVEVARKLLLLLGSVHEEALRVKLLAGALSDGIAAFDALGKALRTRHPGALPANPKNLFQNLEALGAALEKVAGSSPSASFSADEYAFLLRMFQVRHIYEHNAGVIDADFCRRVPGTQHLRGRKYPIDHAEVERFLGLLPALAQAIMARLP
jgi:hypothetical protein